MKQFLSWLTRHRHRWTYSEPDPDIMQRPAGVLDVYRLPPNFAKKPTKRACKSCGAVERRCTTCGGLGQIVIAKDRMLDYMRGETYGIVGPCPDCGGARWRSAEGLPSAEENREEL